MIKMKELIQENVLGELPTSKLIKMKWNPLNEANDYGLDSITDQAEKLGRQFKTFAHAVSRDLDSGENRLVGKALKDYDKFFNSFKHMYKQIS